MTEKEIKGTLVAAIELDEASAKVREGGPVDDEADYAEPIWAGVIPLRLTPGEPIPDDRLVPGVEPPASVVQYERP